MKLQHHYENSSQKEALINELKGNLFEYLMGRLIASHVGREQEYISSIPASYDEQLREYESWLQKNDLDLIQKLGPLAQSTFTKVKNRLPLQGVEKIYLIGKIAGAAHNKAWSEADLLLTDGQGESEVPLSIKLCKSNSFVNTKSGGIFSFVDKYFTAFSTHAKDQQHLSERANQLFLQMGHQLYSLLGGEFTGKFDEFWSEQGMGELPGELSEEMRSILFEYYHQVIGELYAILKNYYQQDNIKFLQSILPLMGMGQKDIIQIYCFHGGVGRYQEKGVMVMDYQHVEDAMGQVEFGELVNQLSSFEIKLKGVKLQIRVKPMNKFTTPGLKINCSLKYL